MYRCTQCVLTRSRNAHSGIVRTVYTIIGSLLRHGLVNILGSCVGTHPLLGLSLRPISPRPMSSTSHSFSVPPPSSALPPCDDPSCDMMPGPIVSHQFVISVVIIFQGGVKMSWCMSSSLHALAKNQVAICYNISSIFPQYVVNTLTIFYSFCIFTIFISKDINHQEELPHIRDEWYDNTRTLHMWYAYE